MRRGPLIIVAACALLAMGIVAPAGADESAYEVWVIDQSDTTADGGGTLYIYDGDAVSGRDAASAVPETIDLGGAARSLCLAQTGTAPRRPHMVMFNMEHTHAVLAWVATGHVLFMDAATRAPLACIDAGVAAHAAFPSPDGTYVVVANLAGKLLQRINTDYETNTFTLDGGATLDLATCTTASGAACQDAALRPDNAPICPVITSDSEHTFVTLRGGGLFIVDSTATPMAIVAEYDQATVHPSGCGGVETAGKMYINSGGGWPANPLEHDLYAFDLSAIGLANPPNTPAPTLVYSHDARGNVDSHGAVLTMRDAFLWVADRAANRVIFVDIDTDLVAGEVSLVGALSADPAPDLMDKAPSGNRVFLTFRGPNPLTGNVAGVNNAVGSTPGLGIMRVEAAGARGVLQAVIPISHLVGGVERADPHALAVRRK
jgi:DNA-binding beta-propeller fold protein YncE